MNNIERDLRRRLKKSIKKRTELNNRCIKNRNIVDKAIKFVNNWDIFRCDKGTLRGEIFENKKLQLLEILQEIE